MMSGDPPSQPALTPNFLEATVLSSFIVSLALTTSPAADAAELSLLPVFLPDGVEELMTDAAAKKGKGKKSGKSSSKGSKKGSKKDKPTKKGDKGDKAKPDKPKNGNPDGQSRNGQSRPADSGERDRDGHPHAHDVHAERPQPGATPHSTPEHRPIPRGVPAANNPNSAPANAQQANETRGERNQGGNGQGGQNGQNGHERPAGQQGHNGQQGHDGQHAHGGQGHVRPGDRAPAAAHRPHQAKHNWRPHRYRPVPVRLSWTLGWFVHPHYVVAGGGSSTGSVASINRKVDRYDTFSAGAKLGSTLGAYEGVADSTYSDTGVGVYGRYRLAEPVGLELAYTYSSTTDQDAPLRYSHTLQPSVQFFLFPWTRVSPYGTLGLTFDTTYDEDRGTGGQGQSVKDSAWGAHAGLGIEFAIGDNVALDFEARAIQFVEGHPDTLDNQIQTSAGLSWYF